MAKYKAYPEYKDSGVEWLGEIPTSWQMWKLSHAYEVIGSGTTPTSNNESYFQGDIPWVTTGELREKIIYDTDKKVKESTLQIFSALKIHPAGSVVIAMYGATIGRLGILGVDATTNQACCVMTKSKIINNQYLYYWLQAYRTEIIRLSSGGGQPNINQEKVSSLKVSAPVLNDQTLIVAFLDHETAKIDNLIEKQQQLIELLKEKRQAVISHAVTKGLNPDVPMKDSGVEWLGKVPEHWTIAQLKFNTIEMQTGPFGSQLHAEDYVVDGIPLINPAHMNAGMIIPDPKVTVDEATQERLGRHKLSEGEIIFSRRGELGRCAVVKKNNEGWLCGTGSLKAKLTKKIIPDYAYTLISSEGVVSELTLESKGSTMANLNTETLGRIRLPVPPISEQEAILDYIKIISDKYDYLIRSADTAIRLMQERRTALISAAVTGKIDVRDWVAPDSQDVEAIQEATA